MYLGSKTNIFGLPSYSYRQAEPELLDAVKLAPLAENSTTQHFDTGDVSRRLE